MKTFTRAALALLLASFASLLLADDLCEGGAAGKAKADAQAKQAEELEKSGRAREAFAAAGKVNEDCVTNLNAVAALKKRSAKAIATDEEKRSRFAEAFDWYKVAGSPADAGRMVRKLVQQKPDDQNTVSRAIEFFHNLPDAAQEKEMREHAARNVEKALSEEEKQFAAIGKDSLSALGLARDWAHHAGSGKEKAMARAEKRGDTLIAEDGRRFLETAMKYYSFAEKKDKEQKVRDKARGLGDRAAAKGEGELAAAYYELAGDHAKAQALQKQTEAKAQQVEEVRKKTFKKDQDALEKELGLDK